MMKKHLSSIVIAFVLLAGASCAIYPPKTPVEKQVIADPESCLLILKNEYVVLGIIPEGGAHIVLFRSYYSANVLDSNPKTWSEPVPAVSAENPKLAPYDGHITWLGPQKEWWTQQDINADRKNRRVPWPPDPFLTIGKYEVSDCKGDYVKLTGPPSPVTGIQMVKEISLRKNTAHIKVTATNIRDNPVSWDIWSNTRIRKNADIYVPVDPEGRSFKIEAGTNHPETNYVLPYAVQSNYFHFDIDSVQKDNAHNYSAKVFMNPSVGIIAAFCENYLFVKKSTIVPKEIIHPDQSFVEIYKNISITPADSLTEIEMHGEYRTLKTGESMSFEETWELTPCGELRKNEDRIRFLESISIY